MALIQRIFCMMVIAMFSYNAGHSGGAVFTPEKLKEKARGAGEEALVLPKKFAQRSLLNLGKHGDDAI